MSTTPTNQKEKRVSK